MSGCNSHHGAQALATGNDEMRSEFVEMCVTGFYRRQQRRFNSLTINIHKWKRKKRRRNCHIHRLGNSPCEFTN
jgi:hypothetical protein